MNDFSSAAFYPVAVMVLAAAVLVVSFKNLIYSALAMIACFAGVAALFVLLHAELLASAQILLYVGAISILILFAIMLTRNRGGEVKLFFHHQAWMAIPVVAIVGLILIIVIGSAHYNAANTAQNPTTNDLASMLFNQYAFPFELVSLVLLVAIIGAILLAKKEKIK